MSTDIREETEQSQAPRQQDDPGALLLYYCVAHRVWAKDRSPITRYRDAWAFCLNGCGSGHEWRRIEPVSYPNLWSFGPTFVEQSASSTP
jgi:hypothetical protein